jgi:branched-chain amino acid transport system substrate-binding protein
LKKLLLVCLMIVLVASILVIGCAQPAPAPAPGPSPAPAPAPAPKEPIKIGFIEGITGYMAPAADELVKGLKLAVEMLGPEIAGRPVQLIIEDTQTDMTVALDKARKLAEQDKVSVVFGPLHGGHAVGTIGYLSKLPVPSMIPFGEVSPVFKGEWGWYYDGCIPQASFPVGNYAYDVLGYRSCSVIATDRTTGHDFINAFEDSFKAKGGKVVQEQYFPETTTEFTPYLAQINQNCDFLASWVGDANQFAFWPQFGEYGIKLPCVQVEAGTVLMSPQALPQLGASVVGVITAGFYAYSLDTPGNPEFVKAFQAKYGHLPGMFSGNVYAGAQIFYDAVKRTNGDTSSGALAAALNATKLDTIVGHIEFPSAKYHAAMADMHIFKINKDLLPEKLSSALTRLDFNPDGTAVVTIVK